MSEQQYDLKWYSNEELQAWTALGKAAFNARRAVENFSLMNADDPAQYVIEHNGYGGHCIWPDEHWRYKGRRDWIAPST